MGETLDAIANLDFLETHTLKRVCMTLPEHRVTGTSVPHGLG